MSSDYFDSSSHQITAGTRARASGVNTALDALDTGLALLPSETNLKRGLINYAVDSGAADAYVVSLTYAPASYTDGMQVVFKASAVNTGASTMNVNALGVKTITRQDGSTLVAGDIAENKITEIRYNSTSGNFEVQGSIGAAAGTGTMSSQNANAVAITGGTMSGVAVSGGTASGVAITGGTIKNTPISDADNDTKIQVEESADEDKIRFDTGGTERMVIDENYTDVDALAIGGVQVTTTPENLNLLTQSLPFFMKRSRFTYNGGATAYTVKVGPGFYYVKDKVAQWLSELTTTAIGTPSASTRYYLYLDYSAITSGTAITNSELIWSSTAPAYNSSYGGWYNGDDLCVIGVITNSGPTNILIFYHDGGNYVQWDDFITEASAITPTGAWTDVDCATSIPGFCTKGMFHFYHVYGDSSAHLIHRVNGSAGTGTPVARADVGATPATETSPAMMDSSQIIEVYTGGTNQVTVYTVGWFFPAGM